MRIIKLRTNHLTNPIGYRMDSVILSYQVTEAKGVRSVAQRIEIAVFQDFSELIFDTGKTTAIDSKAYVPDFKFKSGVRYYWRVTVWDDSGDFAISEPAYFETPPECIHGKWITAPLKDKHAVFMKTWNISEFKSARLYICGLGVYEAYVNGHRVGEEVLAPFCNDYNHWIQYQTYDITDLLQSGMNALGVMLGDGWYKGRFSPLGMLEKLYGDKQILICDVVIETLSGQKVVIPSDESFLCYESPVLESSIYDGEVYDSRKEIENFATISCDTTHWMHAESVQAPAGILQPRLSLPLVVHEELKPVEVIFTPAGERILDFGQIITGVLKFVNRTSSGTKIKFQFGEVLQNGNFYNENLRTAKQEFIYYSNGEEKLFYPHFTFFGFRYVKISGVENIQLEDYTACVIYSDMEQTGSIQTSNPKINRFIENTLWGQKGNFLDVPTDCPQRDERLGWTGDAQIFVGAASFHMYVPGFFQKYLYDMRLEQKEEKNRGAVPHVVPDILNQSYRLLEKKCEQEEHITTGSCAWGDAATVIPWTMYLFYGNIEYLRQNYENMKMWVDFIYRMDEENCNGSRLWTCGFHFADWLALDNFHADSRLGGTDPYYVASAYYLYSATLTAKAAKALCLKDDEKWYQSLADEIRTAMQKEYFTSTGRIAVDTQTAMVLALYFDIVPEKYKERLIQDLKKKLQDEEVHLTTGFVGTAYLCKALSENGLSEYAYTLLLNEDYPGWLYEVNMGATTVWERWNSILPDGQIIKGSEMNSLNHYAYGAVVEWIYRYVCGLNPDENAPGFRHFILCPKPNTRFAYVQMSYESPYGQIKSGWKKTEDGWEFRFSVPFNTTAEFLVPENITYDSLIVNGDESIDKIVHLIPGEYVINAMISS